MSTPDRSTGGVSEVALVLASLVARLGPSDQRHLARQIAHSIAAPSRAALRERVLGLLAELVRHGEKPTVEQYEAARADRAAQGQHWPAATTLIRRYGRDQDERRRARDRHGDGWQKACGAAARLVALGATARVPASYRHGGRKRRYKRSDVTLAIREFLWLYGDWPSQWEYEEHGRVMRLQAAEDPRVPGLQQIATLFGSWDRALEVARAEQEDDR